MKNTLDGGEAILEACRKLGVDYIISSPGTEWAPVWEAMANQIARGGDGPAFIDVWHETLAVNMAAGYTLATGKMQAVLLHAGGGLLQGAMGIHGAWSAGIPMVVISGETMTYGERPDFDPGPQWINNLSIVGGTTRLVEPVVKYAGQAGSIYVLYESVVRAGELAQRAPTGPTYLSVSTETLMEPWTPPKHARTVPPAPQRLTPPEDIDRLARLLAQAKSPLVIAEAAGSDAETYDALLALCELLALPVVESARSSFANFPKDHPLHQGHDQKPFRADADLILVIRTRAPWYPPSDRPPNATIAVIDETPHRDSMVYQSLQADLYLEGNVGRTLRDLAAAVQALGPDAAAIAARRARLAAAHARLWEGKRKLYGEVRGKRPIDPVWLCAALSEVMPADAIYIDEVTTHTRAMHEHVMWNKPQSLFSRHGGLGQGVGLSLGIKLARPDSTVVTLIGDGAFLYNPVLQCLGAARDYKLPTLTVIFDNRKYAAMQQMHLKMYPDGTAVATDTFHGTHINAPDMAKVAESVGGYGEKVEDPDALPDALRRGLKAVGEGRPAIIDVICDR
jgi:thiamine pyrophosphate-dependent acetolactate synthase large subunit-like protein